MARLLLRDLTPGTNYKVQIRAVEGDSVSEWSRLFDLPTSSDTVAPDAPVWLASGDWVVNGDTFVASWEALDFNLEQNKDFDHYEIELGDGSNATVLRTTNTSYTLTFENNRILFGSPKATVTARVRAVDAVGNASPWTSLESATNPAPAPVNSISTNALYDAIDVKWDGGTLPDDFSGFMLQVSTTSASTGFSTIFVGPNTQFQHATTMFNTDHWFRVYTRDKFGSLSTAVTSGAVRPKSSFTVDTVAPNVPTGLAAALTNNANGLGARAAVSWTMTTPPADLAGFYVRYRKVGDTNYSSVAFQKDDRAGIIELQSAFQNYEFQIKAFDWQNNESAWSATVTAASPGNTAPAQITGLAAVAGRDSLRYTWTPSTAADLKEYEVTFATNVGFTTGVITFKTGTAAVLDIGGLNSGTTYYARVRATDNGNLSGTWSATNTTATLAQLTPGDIGAATPADLDTLIKSYITEYSVNSSETVAPTTGWSTATPTRTPGTFVWTRTTVTYNDDTTATTSPALLTGNTGATGSQGIQGPAGSDGTSLYTWLKYADTPTTGMADLPDGKTYIGISYNKTSATESTNYNDYQWSLIKGADGSDGATGPAGADGVGITGTAVTYQVHSNGTTAPTGTWQATPQVTTTGQYLWTRTITSYTSGSPTTAYSVAAHGSTGATGNTGATGRGISATEVRYQVGSSGTTAPTGTWLSTIPSTSPGQFLWTRTVYTFTSAPLTETSYSVSAHGSTGSQGVQGPAGADGITTYTWIKYATDVTGASMSDDPTGRPYIGFAYNKTTATESTTPGDYTWSLIQGPQGPQGPQGATGSQGIQGPQGPSGETLYTWLKYADTPTTGMDDLPAGKTYMGVAYNKTTATESTNYADYAWSLIKGADGATGKGISSTSVTYQTHTSGTTAPTGTWQAAPTATTTGQFLWTRTITTYTDATNSTAYSVSAHGSTGSTGSTGAAGRGISSTAVTYQVHTNGTTAPTGTWLSTVPATSPGQFLWTRTITTYTDALNPTTAYAVAAHGATGSQGIQGPAGADGAPTYTWIKYGNSVNDAAMTDDPAGKTYIGLAYNKSTATESSTPTDYAWSLIQGPQGPQGNTGAAGRGISSTAVTYQVSASGTVAPGGAWQATPQATTVGQFLWTRTIYTYTDATSDTAYSVSAHGSTGATGATGSTGAAGRGITGTTVEYQKHTNGTTAPTGAWTTAIPATTPGEYLWTRTITSYSSAPTSVTSYSVSAHGQVGSDGADGVGISSTTVTYQVHSNGTTAPTGAWSSTPVATTSGQFLWTKTYTTYTDATNSTAYSVAAHGATGPTGAAGADGADGRGISSTAVTYQVHTNGTTAPVGTWVASPPATTAGQFLWTRTVTTYTDASTTTAYSVSAHGATGSTGAAGKGISSTAVTYQTHSNGTTAPTGAWSANPTATTTGQFLWTRTILTYTDATTSTAYAVSAHGATGSTGSTGAAGRGISNTVVNYAKNTDGVTAPSTGWGTGIPATVAGEFLWTRTVTTYTDATSTTAYSVSAHGTSGADGNDGADGVGISGTTVTYQKHSSGTTAPVGTWTAGIPATVAGEFLWTRTVTNFTDASSTTAYSVAAHGAQGPQGNVGATGNGIASSAVTYQVHTNGTTAPTGTWLSSVPSVPAGQFLWTRTILTYTDASTSSPVYAVAGSGANGSNGVSVTSITRYWLRQTAGGATPATPGNVASPGGSWTTTEPDYLAGTELWMMDRVTYSPVAYSYTAPSKSSSYAAAATAITAANGKNKIIFSTGTATGTAYVDGDVWFQKSGTNIIAQWEFVTGAWASRTLSDTVIASLSVGKLVSGSVSTAVITITNTGSVQSDDYVANSTGWKLGAGGLEINEGSVKASSLIGDTIGSSTGVINIAAGAGLVINGGYLKSNTYSGTTYNAAATAGWFLNNDGLVVATGAVKASTLTSGDVSTATINLTGTGSIQTTGYNGTSGFKLSAAGLAIPDGSLAAAKLIITSTFSNSVVSNTTVIDGGKINTGSIQSTAPAKDANGNNIAGLLAWSINTGGAAQFGDVLIRGRLISGVTGDFEASTSTATDADGMTYTYEDTAKLSGIGEMKSYNYVPGQAGWSIRSNGYAEFLQLKSGSINSDVITAISADKLMPGTVVADLLIGTSIRSVETDTLYVTTKARTSNVATLTLADNHTRLIGDRIKVRLDQSVAADTSFDTPGNTMVTVTAVTANTISYANTGANVGATAHAGTSYITVEGRSVMVSPQGVTLFNNDGVGRVVDLPTDPMLPAYFAGDVEANSLTVQNDFLLQGTDNAVAAGGIFTLNASIVAPAGTPTINFSWDQVETWMKGGDDYSAWKSGLLFDANRYITTNAFFGSQAFGVNTDGSFNFNIGAAQDANPYGITKVNGKFYILVNDNDDGLWKVRRYAATGTGLSTVDLEWTYNRASTFGCTATEWKMDGWNGSALKDPVIGSGQIGGTGAYYIFIARPTKSGKIMVTRYTDAGTYSAEVTTNITDNQNLKSINVGAFDYGSDRYIITTGGTSSKTATNYVTNTSGTHQTSETWGSPGGNKLWGTCWNGSQFVSLGQNHRLYFHTSLAHSGTNLWYAKSSWYDGNNSRTLSIASRSGNGTTTTLTTSVAHGFVPGDTIYVSGTGGGTNLDGLYFTLATASGTTMTFGSAYSGSGAAVGTVTNEWETGLSGYAGITATRRAKMTVGSGNIPVAGGANVPDRARFYFGLSTVGSYYRQTNPNASASQEFLTNPTFSGSTTTLTAFPSGTPAVLKSNNGKMEITADGYALFGATDDVNASAGNRPAVRIGNPAAEHLRIDGNELQAMDSDSAVGTLVVNGSGGTFSTGGSNNFGALGRTFKTMRFGSHTGNSNASGQTTTAHGLGEVPDVIIVSPHNSGPNRVSMVQTGSRTSTNFVVSHYRVDNNAVVASAACDFYWIAFSL